MIVINKIAVSAEFDSGTFMGTFNVTSTKNSGYSDCDINIQTVESLTHDDFKILEIMIGSAVSKYLDAKNENKNENKNDSI